MYRVPYIIRDINKYNYFWQLSICSELHMYKNMDIVCVSIAVLTVDMYSMDNVNNGSGFMSTTIVSVQLL